MKKSFLVLLIMVSIALAAAAQCMAEDDFEISAKAAVVMDPATGAIIISKNKDLKLPPASTTKVMSAVVALEKSRLSDVFKVSKRASCMSPSKVCLKPGDEITVEALLYSMLLKSANDSAAALAEGVGGSELNFARMMTEKAKEIGAVNTNYMNASGLPTSDHYTTAYDLALILSYALKDDRFVAISATKFATLNMGEKYNMLLKNHNKMLWCYEGAGPGKTGYTNAARHCYVGEANSGSMRLVVAVLHSENLWTDVRKLLDKGFELAMTGQTLALEDKEPVMKKASYRKPHRLHRRHRRKKRI